MAEYRLYCLDERGRIERRHEFEAAGDPEALTQAHAFEPTVDRELWCSARKVAVLPAVGTPAKRSLAGEPAE